MNILDEIFSYKRAEIDLIQRKIPFDEVRRAAEAAPPALDFIGVLKARSALWPALIAEIKHASPSRGVLVEDFDPIHLAQIYQGNGASAVSILTDEHYFQGSLENLRCVRQTLPDMPVLRKDFICDPYQVCEARAAGADAILLIAASLEPSLLNDLHQMANQLGMAALVEIHNQSEMDRALSCSPALVGINNRDLRDFTVRIETSLDLRPRIPAEICLVSESGIHSAQDVRRLACAGFNAILIGEALVTAHDITAKVRELAYPSPERTNHDES